MKISILYKRPVITVFCVYCLSIIILNFSGFFQPAKQSFLYYFTNYQKPLQIEGKIISNPEITRSGKRFILKVCRAGAFSTDEKVLVNTPPAYEVNYGDIIALEGRINKPVKAAFPLVFDYRSYLARNGIYTVFNTSYFEYIASKPNPVKKFALQIQQDIVNKIDYYFKKPYAGILKPIVIGDKSSLESKVKESFSDAGLTHILVVSGLHVGFIGAIFLALFKASGLSLRKASLLSIPFVFLYVIAAGANPPALRAGIMFASMLTALALDREPLIYNSLALSALLILFFQPQQLFTASFQMSYAATLGIVYFYEKIYEIFSFVKNPVLKFLCGVFSVTLSAQIPLIPVCMYYFGKASLISFAANIIIVPAVGVILALGIVFYISTFISAYPAVFFSSVLSLILQAVISTTVFLGNLPFAAAQTGKPPVLQVIGFFFFVFALTYLKGKKRFILPAAILAITVFCATGAKLYEKEIVRFNIYNSKNTVTLQVKEGGKSSFVLCQKGNYYDKYYINAFKQYMSFAKIKEAGITAAGFDKNILENDLRMPFETASYAKKQKMKFASSNVTVEMSANAITVNSIFSAYFKNNPGFSYNKKKSALKFKNSYFMLSK